MTLSLLSALLVAAAAQGAAAEWVAPSCLALGGGIVIEGEAGQEIVPDSATTCGFCDNSTYHPVILEWNKDTVLKVLIFYITDKPSSRTFQLEQILYMEGERSWSLNLSGIKGNICGKVLCNFTIASNLEYDNGNFTDAYRCPSSKAAGPARNAGSAPGRQTDGDSPQRAIRLTNFFAQYCDSDKASDKAVLPQDVSGCRLEPDLTMLMGVSGAITACALLAAAFAAAPRLLC